VGRRSVLLREIGVEGSRLDRPSSCLRG